MNDICYWCGELVPHSETTVRCPKCSTPIPNNKAEVGRYINRTVKWHTKCRKCGKEFNYTLDDTLDSYFDIMCPYCKQYTEINFFKFVRQYLHKIIIFLKKGTFR
jgi:DNA-directed RNA polymerase subunit RPC12/RpoP